MRVFETDANGQRIASVISAWLILDTRSKRPVRVQSVFAVPALGDTPRALAESFEKLDGPESPVLEREITVRWSDVDVNRNVSKGRYAEWAVEGAAGNPSGTGTIARMSHAIVRAEDGVEAARARTQWRTS
jgi:acyl-ACP thioesterase